MKWNDEYWPLLVQLYKRNPEGVKPLYSKPLVSLALRLHVHPAELHSRLEELHAGKSASIRQLLADSEAPGKLSRMVKRLEQSMGYGTAGQYYDNIETQESWELDFRPLKEEPRLMPVHLIVILDEYYRLTPTTMAKETEEVKQLAHLLKIPVRLVVDIFDVYRFCDPYLNRDDIMIDPLLFPCKDVWSRFSAMSTIKLAQLAAELKEYFA